MSQIIFPTPHYRLFREKGKCSIKIVLIGACKVEKTFIAVPNLNNGIFIDEVCRENIGEINRSIAFTETKLIPI